MAKTIKFNLILDNKPVRTIEDLRENFSIEDILDLHNNGLLQRWLEVRGYSELLKKIESIKVDSNIEKIHKLINIFDVESNENEISEGIAILDYLNKKKLRFEKYNTDNFQVETIVKDYHLGYKMLIQDIIQNKDNFPKIKASINEIEKNYLELFKLNYRELYNKLIEKAPLAIFAIIMNDNMKNYFISNENSNGITDAIYKKIKALISNKTVLKKKLGKELCLFKGSTQQYWKDIEPRDKKLMIISMEDGNYIRNAGAFGEELERDDINNNFKILNGIDYKSNSDNDELLYMEV